MQRRCRLSSEELTQPVFTAWPTETYSSIAEVPRTSPFWRIWCDIQEWTRLNLKDPGLHKLAARSEHLHERWNSENNPAGTSELITSSNSFWVSSSIRLMSSMVKPTHLSIQQNSWRWKFVKIRFSCCKRKKKFKNAAEGIMLLFYRLVSTLWMKFSTLVCRPHHLNLTVTSLYAHMWGHSGFSSFCVGKKRAEHSHPLMAGISLLCFIHYLPLRT